jgi:hypothetical protein
MLPKLTWTCHVCGEERPDSMIAVYHKPWVFRGEVVGMQNIRYCVDKPECFEGAQRYSFVDNDEGGEYDRSGN